MPHAHERHRPEDRPLPGAVLCVFWPGAVSPHPPPGRPLPHVLLRTSQESGISPGRCRPPLCGRQQSGRRRSLLRLSPETGVFPAKTSLTPPEPGKCVFAPHEDCPRLPPSGSTTAVCCADASASERQPSRRRSSGENAPRGRTAKKTPHKQSTHEETPTKICFPEPHCCGLPARIPLTFRRISAVQ